MDDPTRSQFIDYYRENRIPQSKIDEALHASQVYPRSKNWLDFIDRLLLICGALALAIAVVFFVAANWSGMSRVEKFVLLQSTIVLPVLAYFWLHARPLIGKLCLFVACITLGATLAFFGQTYQTGADPWQLFFNWALLIIPWVIISGFPALWVLWAALLNLSIMLYFQAGLSVWGWGDTSGNTMLWCLWLWNVFASVMWEWARHRFPSFSPEWPRQVFVMAAVCAITFNAVNGLFERPAQWSGLFAWGVTMVVGYYLYRLKSIDLLMLVAGCISSIVVVIALLVKLMPENSYDVLSLLLSFVVIGLGSAAAAWLKTVYQEQRHD